MKTLWGIFIGLMFFITIMYSLSIVGEEIQDNSNLDQTSVSLIGNLTTDLNTNFNPNSSFQEGQSSLSENSSFDSQDVFAQEFLEGKSESQKKASLVTSIVKSPDTIILAAGVEESNVTTFRLIILLILTVSLSFAIYRTFFGGGKVTLN